MTGASGFVGGHLVRRLAANGDRVLAYGRREAAELEALPGVTYGRWDISRGQVAATVVDGVVHCAGAVSDWGPRAGFVAVNVVGTENVLRTFAQAPRFIHISTASVYDARVPKRMIREDSAYPADYLNAYSETKMLAEVAVRSYRADAVILRPHAVYGRGEPTLLPRLRKARRLGRQLALGDGHNRLSITHVDNLVDAILLGLNGASAGTFNISDEPTPTLADLLGVFLEADRRSPSTLYVPTWLAWRLGSAAEMLWAAARRRRPPMITRYSVAQLAFEFTLDISRARRDLGYCPRVDFRRGIADACEPADNHPPDQVS